MDMRIAAALLWISAAGLGLSCLQAIKNLLSGHDLPIIMGFRAFGGGPFERRGIRTTVRLLVGFLLVCALEAWAGWWLWNGHKAGAILALALLLPGAVYWWGFALPYPPIFAVARTLLIILGWSALK